MIGKRGRRIPVEEAHDYVAGYTIRLDLTARDWQRHPKHLVKFGPVRRQGVRRQLPLRSGHRARAVRRRRKSAAAFPSQR
ncbi:MAG: fumarylacetoacetate hydrolase family protein [Mycobacterium sp.]